jgi:tetratricopeptide (TPR) repeat protein
MHSIFRLFFFVLILILSVNSSYADPNEELLDRAIALRQQGKLAKAAEVLNELAFYYWDNKKFEKAILTFDQVVIINKELNNEEQLRIIYSNIALVYSDMGDPETALLFFRKALVLSQQHNNPEEIAENLLNIGITLIYLHRENEAALKLEEALQQAQKTNNRKLLKNCYGKLATIYKRLEIMINQSSILVNSRFYRRNCKIGNCR